jgi:general stress protein YciG
MRSNTVMVMTTLPCGGPFPTRLAGSEGGLGSGGEDPSRFTEDAMLLQDAGGKSGKSSWSTACSQIGPEGLKNARNLEGFSGPAV